MNLKSCYLFLKGTKGCADIVLEVWRNHERFYSKKKNKLIEQELIKYSKKFPAENQNEALDYLKKIIEPHNREFINEFNIGEKSCDIKTIIIKAFFKSKYCQNNLLTFLS